jgi:ABC-type sugar transport system permease subunit
MGYASAVAWTLFAIIFAVTLLNWKFGSRAINE